MRRISYDVISSILLIIVSIIAIWGTKELSEMSYVFPRSIAILFLILSLVYFIMSIIKLKAQDIKKLFEQVNKKKVLFMSFGMIVYSILIALIGFLMASIPYLAVCTWYLQKEVKEKSNLTKWIHSLISGLGVSLFFYVLFRYVFLVPLPPGILFGG